MRFSFHHAAAVVTVWAAAAGAVAQTSDFPITLQRGNGLANVFAKLNGGQTATIAYFGGSITQGAGYRDLVTNWLKARYPGKIVEINAGWGGTGSLIGAMRLGRDVLAHAPDLMFVEFAVNDLPEDPLIFVERNSEGIVRQTFAADATTDVCFLETIAWYTEGPYLAGNLPTPVQAHYNVADHYGCPSVNIGWALYEHVLAGTPWTDLAPDRVHPNAAGSQIYADAIIAYLDAERTRNGPSTTHAMPTELTDYPVMTSVITELASIDPLPAGWVKRFNQFGAASFIESSTPGTQVTLGFDGPAAALKIVAGPDGGDIAVSIDGGPFASAGIPPFDFHFIWAVPVAKMQTFGHHTLTLRVTSGVARLINVESAQTADVGGPGPGDVNLALTAVASTADSFFGAGFEAAKARDGNTGTKWTSTNTSPTHWLAMDLGAQADVSAVIVKHAGAGGEWEAFNTTAFTIETGPSLTGPWSVEFVGANPNQVAVSTFTYAVPRRMRYVRLNVIDAGIDDYARIPELEVWGVIATAKADFDKDGDADLADYGHFQACYSGPGFAQSEPACANARLDGDTDVDLDDFGLFQGCMTGAGLPADVNCVP